jgi:hypothetical protein
MTNIADSFHCKIMSQLGIYTKIATIRDFKPKLKQLGILYQSCIDKMQQTRSQEIQ